METDEGRTGEETTGSTDSEDAEGSLELEETWSEARTRAGLDPEAIGTVRPDGDGPGLFSPYLVLYAGFFLGPALSFASGLLVAPRRVSIRRVTVMLGICGAAWCAIQGVSGVFGGHWSNLGLQMVRSGMNFAASALLLIFLRREIPSSFVHDRTSIAASFAAGTVFLVVFVYLPPEILAYIGR